MRKDGELDVTSRNIECASAFVLQSISQSQSRMWSRTQLCTCRRRARPTIARTRSVANGLRLDRDRVFSLDARFPQSPLRVPKILTKSFPEILTTCR